MLFPLLRLLAGGTWQVESGEGASCGPGAGAQQPSSPRVVLAQEEAGVERACHLFFLSGSGESVSVSFKIFHLLPVQIFQTHGKDE